MTRPSALMLRECGKNERGKHLPFAAVNTYALLSDKAYVLFQRDRNDYEVHFHFGDGFCAFEIAPSEYDAGNYFVDDHMHDNNLFIFACFEHRQKEQDKHANGIPLYLQQAREELLQPAPRNGIVRASAPPTARRVQHLELVPTIEEDMGLPSDGMNMVEQDIDLHDERATTIPRGTVSIDWFDTPTNVAAMFRSDLAYQKANNQSQGDKFHHQNYAALSDSTRDRWAHAKLIVGGYGILAPKPCASCIKYGTVCEVYHPKMHTLLKRRIGNTCAACRVHPDRGRCTVGINDVEVKVEE